MSRNKIRNLGNSNVLISVAGVGRMITWEKNTVLYEVTAAVAVGTE